MARTAIFTNPSLSGPAFKFGKGIDGVAAYYEQLPAVETKESDWHIAEWHTDQTLNPANLLTNYVPETDVILGKPTYSWKTDNNNIRLSAYKSDNGYSYRLSSFNGILAADGAQNIFLEAGVRDLSNSFDHPITFDADEAFTSVIGGGIAQQAGNNFTVAFNAPGTTNYNPAWNTMSVFLQVLLSDSRGVSAYAEWGQSMSLYNLAGVATMPFQASSSLSHISINLNEALKSFIADYKQNSHYSTPNGFGDLKNWALTSSYIGLETTKGGGASMDVRNVELNIDKEAIYKESNASAVSITSATEDNKSSNASVGIVNQETGMQTISRMEQVSDGPDYLQWKYIYSGSNGVAMATSVPNAFLHGGSGTDAIQATSGRNVLDGGLGSNFLTGGSGSNTFFTDARSSGIVWNTIRNFHSGDAATLWGFTEKLSSYYWDDKISGAAGSEGATLRANIVGGAGRSGDGIDASITFSGVSIEEAKSFHVSTGRETAGDYLYISR